MPLIADKVIAVAKSQIGYHEKATWDNLDDPTANPGDANYNKYSRDLAALHYYNSSKKGVMWCDIFVDWCFAQAYGADIGRRMLYQPLRSAGAGCSSSRKYFADHHAMYDTPEPGDQVFFWSASDLSNVSHTGLVTKIDRSRIYTVEGNSDNQVKAHKYRKDFERFAGFGRPNWSLVKDTPKESDKQMDYMTVTAPSGGTVRVRKRPDENAPCVDTLKIGTVVQTGPEENGWRKIVYDNGKNGWMMSKFLEPVQVIAENKPITTPTDIPLPTPPETPSQIPIQSAVGIVLPYDAAVALRDALIAAMGVG